MGNSFGSNLYTHKTQIISFEGIIGAGKTTTIEHISKNLEKKGYSVYIIKENVDEWVEDGLLQRFYEDPKRNAYLFQTKAYIDKIKKFNEIFNWKYGTVDFIITERNIISDYIFASLTYKMGLMDELEFKYYKQWYSLWETNLPEPFKKCTLVYLKLDPNTAMQRIKQRGRDGESKITLEYETNLYELHEEYFNKNNNIIWDSEKNIHKQKHIDKLTKIILKHFS